MDATIDDGLEEFENVDDSIEIDVISLNNEEPQIQTIQIEKQSEIKEESPKGLTKTINENSSKIKSKGPLYKYRTNRSNKNRSTSTD